MRYKFTTLFFMLGILVFGLSILEHEQVHKQIWRYDGINSHYGYSIKDFTVQTIADRPCNTRECVESQMMNEVVGYNMTSILMMLFVGFEMVIFMREYHNG